MNVSIIVPVYQVAPYIEACLKSVMQQTYRGSMECLLIDDCGTDDSIAIAERLTATYDGPVRFQVLHHERNRGLSASRNTGLAQAEGEFIFFLDSDDEISHECIELLMRKVEEDDTVELVQGLTRSYPIKNIDGLSTRISVTKASSNEDVRKCFYQSRQLVTSAWNKLIKRSFLENHDISFVEGLIFEDTPWLFDMLKHLTKVSFVKEITYHYKRRTGSIVTGSSNARKSECFENIFRHIANNLTLGYEQQEVNYYGRKFSFFYARYSRFSPEMGDVYQLWKKKAKEYGSLYVRMRMATSKVLAKFKYGWIVLSMITRIEQPSLIPSDVMRLYRAALKERGDGYCFTNKRSQQ